MFGLIESIFLSDFLIFVVISMMLLMVTSWAFRHAEYAGYALGWLVGIFFIVVYSAVVGENSVPLQEAAEANDVQLNMLAVMIVSLIGLMFGFGLLFFMRLNSNGTQRRALTVASLTSLLIISLFILATADPYTRRLLGIFMLAFAIGALSTIVLGAGTPMRRTIFMDATSQSVQPGPSPLDVPPPTSNGPSGPYIPRAPTDSIQSNFNRLRRRNDRQ